MGTGGGGQGGGPFNNIPNSYVRRGYYGMLQNITYGVTEDCGISRTIIPDWAYFTLCADEIHAHSLRNQGVIAPPTSCHPPCFGVRGSFPYLSTTINIQWHNTNGALVLKIEAR